MFERFTQDARDIVVGAQGEARALDHPGIGTSHLLLALVRQDGPCAALLAERGVTHDCVRTALAGLLGDVTAPGRTDSVPTRTDGTPTRADDDQRAQDAAALAALGIDLDRIREAVEAAFGPGALERAGTETDGDAAPPQGRRRRAFSRLSLGRAGGVDERHLLLRGHAGGGHLPFGADAKKALELSLREALRLGDGYIGGEHLLLGLIRGGDTVAAGILARLEVDAAELRNAVERTRRRSA